MKRKKVIAAAIGECVHVAGVSHFLSLAEQAGWEVEFLGPAVPIDVIIKAARDGKADLVGVSYRLTPETGERLLAKFAEEASDLKDAGVEFAFAGTPPVAERVAKIGFFDQVFDGTETPEMVLAYLRGTDLNNPTEVEFPQSTVERIEWKRPYPLLRHHFGLPSMEATILGIQKIAEARCLDLISLGTDQDAQENFFHPDRQDPRQTGAGGVPVRTRDDLRQLFEASRRGNFPLMRAYSGTDDFIRYAEMLTETIHNAWCAIPLFWFNQMDGRGPWDLKGSIEQHQQVMSWYGERNIPVELNEPHHWGMRDSSDVVYVVSGYLAAYNAKFYGVRDYIAQFMFNSPPGTSDAMDLAKMLAILELIKPLENAAFRVWRQTRIGLLSHPIDQSLAKGHLAASTYMQMSLKPHIYHIVGHTEAHHAATADDVIEASKIVRAAIQNSIGAPDATVDAKVQARKEELMAESKFVLDTIAGLAAPTVPHPLADSEILSKAVTSGILDAPQLKNNQFALGKDRTRILDGKSVSIDLTGRPIAERDRISKLLG